VKIFEKNFFWKNPQGGRNGTDFLTLSLHCEAMEASSGLRFFVLGRKNIGDFNGVGIDFRASAEISIFWAPKYFVQADFGRATKWAKIFFGHKRFLISFF
jgi:hypothetical protein